MLLYLSAAVDDADFAKLLGLGWVTGGHQAQKFNSLVIKGLASHTPVNAISNPPYTAGDGETSETQRGNIHYTCLSANPGRFHKLRNFMEMRAAIKKCCQREKPEAVICDAISPLPSACGLLAGRRYHVPTIAVVTDIPEYMDAGHVSFFTGLTSFLMKKYDGFVFLTEAMNPLENKHGRPYIIMEGLCDAQEAEAEDGGQAEPNGTFTCVYTGSLSENTGLEELLTAFSDSSMVDITLLIYGGGKLADTVRQYEKRCPNIRYGGIVNNQDAVRAQKQADLLINPRPADILYGNVSFPSKLMEYMVSGTPVLTTRLPGIPKAYFEYVYAMDDNSPKEIIHCVKSIISEAAASRNEKGEKARRFVLEQKNNIRQAARILELARGLRGQTKNCIKEA